MIMVTLGGLRANAQTNGEETEFVPEGGVFEEPLSIFLSDHPSFVREPLTRYISVLRDQFNRLTLTSSLTPYTIALMGLPTMIYLLEPFLNIVATAMGALIGPCWSLVLWPLRVVGFPVGPLESSLLCP